VTTLIENRADVFLQIGGQNNAWDAGLARLDSSKQVFLGGLPDGGCPWQHLLHQLAELYARGTPVHWKNFDRDYPRCRLELPTYPFQRKRFWSDPAGVALSGKYGSRDPRLQEGMHPMLGRRIVMAHQPDHVLFETVVDTNHPLLGTETNPEEPITAPESFYQEMARAAAEVAAAGSDVQFDGLVTHEELTLKPHRPRVVQLALLPDEAGSFRFELFSRDGEGSDKPPTWTRHVSARVVVE
jgi:acyl transferase domain-containing protein